MEWSNYFKSLNGDEKKRYSEKVQNIWCGDPFQYDYKSISVDENIPPISQIDIIEYFIYKKSVYSLKDFKAKKSLEGYNYFLSGHINLVRWIHRNGIHIIFGKVKHSFSVSKEEVSLWLVVNKDGIETGHCTCVAGNGECCSHLANVCFYIEYLYNKKENVACTEELPYWMQPGCSSNRLSPKQITKVCYTNSKRLRLSLNRGEPLLSEKENKISSKIDNICKPVNIEEFLGDVKEADSKCALLRVVPPFNSEIAKLFEIFPLSYKYLYDVKYETFKLEELVAVGNKLNYSLSEEQRIKIELSSRAQSKCKLWFTYRSGRITGSCTHAVCHTRSFSSSPSLLSRICYPATKKFINQATDWGCTHEKDAIAAFQKFFNTHINGNIEKCGLFVHPSYPFLGASPDSLISCSCCGIGILEVKCPFCLKEKSIENLTYLSITDGELHLQREHSYYTQVQMEIFCAKADFGYFFVWSPKGDHHIEKILPNADFFNNDIVPKCTNYFKNAVVPQLLGRYYTNRAVLKERDPNILQPNLVDWFCICKSNAKGKVIICKNEGCHIAKYHMKCVGLQRMRKNWVCETCIGNH